MKLTKHQCSARHQEIAKPGIVATFNTPIRFGQESTL